MVGEIPAGKWNLQIRLTAKSDVDVQLLDVEDRGQFPEGKASAVGAGACGGWIEHPRDDRGAHRTPHPGDHRLVPAAR